MTLSQFEKLLRSAGERKIAEIMDREQIIFKVTDEQDDVAFKFEQYNLISAAWSMRTGALSAC